MDDENMDLDFKNLTREQVLAKYSENLEKIRIFAETKQNMSSKDFDKYVSIYLRKSRRERIQTSSWSHRFDALKQLIELRRKTISYFIFFLLCLVLFYYKHEISSIFLRNIQVYIYPGMKLWRKITAPIILFFPSLTGNMEPLNIRYKNSLQFYFFQNCTTNPVL